MKSSTKEALFEYLDFDFHVPPKRLSHTISRRTTTKEIALRKVTRERTINMSKKK
jgi:hypothetical protein